MNTAMVIKGVPDAKQLKLAADIIKKPSKKYTV